MPEPNFRNRTLFHGDNLKFLQAIDSGMVHLIATDPPFNKSRDFHATPDSLAAGGKFEDRWRYDKDVHPEWIDAIKDDQPAVWSVIDTANEIHKKKGKQKEDGSDMGAFLCYMGVRIMEMHRILCENGTIYLHLDHTASHYLKAMMDAIFGKQNFRNEIVWCYSGGGIPRKDFPRKYDRILRYTKGNDYTFHVERKPYKENTQEVGIHSTYSGPDNKIDLARGTPITDWWTDIPTVTGWSPQNYGYRTQKPLALYERIIRASSNEGDIVLDPFAGCATTVVAAELLNRQWIGMDIWDGAHKAVVQRLITVSKLSPSGVPDDMLADLAIPDQQGQLITFGELHYETAPPERTDNREIAVPAFELPPEYQKAKWERLSHDEIRAWLEPAQADGENIICAGCGRRLHRRFMELDHIRPRASGGPNTIDNRVLMCRPCNGEKKADLAMSGLWKKNTRDKWMEDPDAAKMAFNAARAMAERVRRTLR